VFTQVVFGRAPVHDWRKYLYLSAVHRFPRESPAVDVHIVIQEPEDWQLGVKCIAIERARNALLSVGRGASADLFVSMFSPA
jgi:hypothetical protein